MKGSDHELSQPFLDHEDHIQEVPDITRRRLVPDSRPIRLLGFLAFILSVSANLFAVYVIHGWKLDNLDAICSSYTSQYGSPILEHVDMRYQEVTFNGSLFQDNIYRMPAGPEVDEAWENLGLNLENFFVPEVDAAKYGLDRRMAKRRSEDGGGLVVSSEGLHHLHCLNLLRKVMYWNYDYYLENDDGPFQDPEEVLQKHAGHCLDIVRQQLMCSPDTGVFGQWWTEHDGVAHDFSTKHKCKNFAGMRDFVREQQVPSDQEPWLRFQPGDVRLPGIP